LWRLHLRLKTCPYSPPPGGSHTLPHPTPPLPFAAQQQQQQQQQAVPKGLSRKNDLVVWLRLKPLQRAVYEAFLHSGAVGGRQSAVQPGRCVGWGLAMGPSGGALALQAQVLPCMPPQRDPAQSPCPCWAPAAPTTCHVPPLGSCRAAPSTTACPGAACAERDRLPARRADRAQKDVRPPCAAERGRGRVRARGRPQVGVAHLVARCNFHVMLTLYTAAKLRRGEQQHPHWLRVRETAS